MTTRRAKMITQLAAILVVAMGLGATDAAAKRNKPADRFAGKIITSDKRIPTKAKSASAYIAKLRKAHKTKFKEDKENKRWKVYFGAFFKRPLRSVEVQIKLFDITEGSPKLVTSFEQYLAERGVRSYISKVTLERETFGVNRRILMRVEDNGRVIAQSKFRILGEGPKYTGKVDFTDEEDDGGKKK